jgi:hypothetical protein
MLAKRIISLLAILCCLLPASAVLAAEVDCDSEYCFSGEEFGQSLTGVCIIGLPDEATGTVLLGTRVVRSGDILTQGQLSQLTFRPLRTETDAEATVTYLPIYEDRVEREKTLVISVRGKVDQVPVAEDSVLETYKNLANQGRLKAHDPEGTALTYTVTRGPKRGEVTVNADGTFTYTPKKNKVGTDSFTYTVTDAAGNVSRQATVTVQILKPADKTLYTDTLGQDCRFAAEWLKNTGLFMGETLAGQSCFQPEKTVSRGEFVTMLVRTLGLRVEDHAGSTGFSEDVPTWLKPYLAAVQRAGLTAGWPDGNTFGAQKPITGPEAALLIQNALDMPTSVMAGDMPLTEWALAVLAENALELPCEGALNRADVALALYQVSQLLPDAPGMTVFRQ